MSNPHKLIENMQEMLKAAAQKDLHKIKELDVMQDKIIQAAKEDELSNSKVSEESRESLVQMLELQNQLINQVRSMRDELNTTILTKPSDKSGEGYDFDNDIQENQNY